MRIAFVSLMGGLPWGGSEALWYSIALFALQQGDEVFVSVYAWGKPHNKLKQLQQMGAVIHYRSRYNAEVGPLGKIKRFILQRRPSLNKDYQSLIGFKPECILISQGDSFDLAIHHRPLYSLIKQHKIDYSFICHSHVQYSFISPKEIYPAAVEIFQNAKHVFFVSRRQWALTERRLAMKILNGQFTWNPLNLYMPDLSLPWPDEPTVQMAIVGNLSGTKGHDTALEVLSSPQWKERNWVLNIYGEGEGKMYLEELAKFYAIYDKVIFHGHVGDILRVWKQNHLLLLPSAGEGLPISLVEAMICGRVPVATDVGGNAELIIDEYNGFLAVSPATYAFSDALERTWNVKNDWEQIGTNAFNNIKSVIDTKPQVTIYKLMLGKKLEILS
jgi:glycosyltransferase involved in cell wall biosynthesis